jgi:hypothetical protein
MHRWPLALAGALAMVTMGAAPRASLDPVTVGEKAPEIEAGTWFNQIGRPPTLNNLRGHAVLIEFWATW